MHRTKSVLYVYFVQSYIRLLSRRILLSMLYLYYLPILYQMYYNVVFLRFFSARRRADIKKKKLKTLGKSKSTESEEECEEEEADEGKHNIIL